MYYKIISRVIETADETNPLKFTMIVEDTRNGNRAKYTGFVKTPCDAVRRMHAIEMRLSALKRKRNFKDYIDSKPTGKAAGNVK